MCASPWCAAACTTIHARGESRGICTQLLVLFFVTLSTPLFRKKTDKLRTFESDLFNEPSGTSSIFKKVVKNRSWLGQMVPSITEMLITIRLLLGESLSPFHAQKVMNIPFRERHVKPRTVIETLACLPRGAIICSCTYRRAKGHPSTSSSRKRRQLPLSPYIRHCQQMFIGWDTRG